MAGIKVAMSVLSDESYISPEDKSVLQKVVAEITQLEGLMKNFLNFAKPQKPRLESINVNQVLNNTLAFHLKHQAAGNVGSGKIEIVKEFGNSPDAGRPDPAAAGIPEPVLNALHAMPRGGELGVRTCMEETERGSGSSFPTPGAGSAKTSSTKCSSHSSRRSRRGPGWDWRSPSR